MSDDKLDSAIRQIYGKEDLTRSYMDDPAGTLESLGVDTSDLVISDPIVPSPEEAASVCASVCPGVPVINACVGATVGKDL